METKINVISEAENELEVSLSYDEILPEIEEAYKEERKNISMPGFRKGKVPTSMLKKMYGEAIEYKASEKIANSKFWNIVDEMGLKPISTPQLVDIDYDFGKKLSFKIKYEVMPQIELKDYKGQDIEKPIFKIKDDDIDKEINHMLKAKAAFEETEIVEGDSERLTLNLQRLDKDGNPVEGQRSENIKVELDDPKVNPQIPQNSKGKKVGDTFDFTFVDEHYHGEELHKEEFNYSAEIVKIEKIVLPEVTEELVKEISRNKAATLDELKEQTKKNFEDYYNSQTENIFTNQLLDRVIKNNEFAVPKGYVEMLLNRMVENEKENAKRYKVPNFNEREVRQNLQARAEWNAKWQIILENLARIEEIKVEDADIEEMAKTESERIGIDVEKLMKYFKESNKTETLLEEKVVKFLKENNNIIEVDPEEKLKEKKDK
ncbi:MAG: trigger factor [Melioribacteraceae bacterium]|nr:trigger factor [Melioribacteraceae bacterium]